MKPFSLPLLGLTVLLLCACQTEPQTAESTSELTDSIQTVGKIETLKPSLKLVLSPNAQMEVLSEGHVWTEGPVWVPELEAVLFCDIPPNKIFKWSESEGATLYLTPSGYTGAAERGGEVGSNGLLLDAEGSLVLCQHGDRRVARMEAPLTKPAPDFVSLAERWDGKRLNSPNDAVFHPNGNLYFTDPPYGLEFRMEDSTKEIDFQGVYMVDAAQNVQLLTDELSRPNGIAFSPDYQTAYVANSDPARAIWMAYDVQEDGTFANGRIFFDATDKVANHKGLPDGLKVNAAGILFATGPGGVLIFSSDGSHLGTLNTGEATSNCAFGADEKTLFITADMYLLKVDLR
ncbi:MAG: SMP-30/gluconolactonase/LRE family protein [Bacteroidota bacterium]